MNFITEMDNIIADFYKSTDEIIKKAKSTGKEGKRGKGDTTHCSPSTLSTRPTLQPIEKIKWEIKNKKFDMWQFWLKQCEIIDTVNKLINSLGEK